MKKGLLALVLLLSLCRGTFAGEITESVLKNWLDFSCVDFKIKGICIKHKHFHIKVGVKVSYYLPVAVVEAPPSPYQTAIAPLKPVLKTSEPAVDKLVSSIPIFSSLHYELGGNIEGLDDTYYREVHIFSFPGMANPVLQILPMACGDSNFPLFVWLSETDPFDWRLGFRDYARQVQNLPAKLMQLKNAVSQYSSAVSSPANTIKNFASKLKREASSFSNSLKGIKTNPSDWKNLFSKTQGIADKVGKKIPDGGWGSKTPHIGYVHDISSTIAYHLMAVRALDLAFPLKPRWGEDKFQMILPTQTACYKLGSDRIKTETGKMVKGDNPVWIYWYHYECCVF